MAKERAIVFVDGSNFYHGMKDAGIRPSGLDYVRLSQKLIGDRELIEIRFYIGKIKQLGSNDRLYKGQRQFLSRLQQQELVSIFYGRLQSTPAKGAARKLNRLLSRLPCDAPISSEILQDLRRIAQSEEKQWIEKGVDVMIAIDMVIMASKDKYDVAYLLSADGDFTSAVQEVRNTDRKVFVASASPGYEISKVAYKFIRLRREFFNGCWQ